MVPFHFFYHNQRVFEQMTLSYLSYYQVCYLHWFNRRLLHNSQEFNTQLNQEIFFLAVFFDLQYGLVIDMYLFFLRKTCINLMDLLPS